MASILLLGIVPEVKLAYFHLLSADNDDHDLGAAKTLGYVPTTCLLGGVLVWKSIDVGVKPCGSCNGPREKCHGSSRQSYQEETYSIERDRLRRLFTGE